MQNSAGCIDMFQKRNIHLELALENVVSASFDQSSEQLRRDKIDGAPHAAFSDAELRRLATLAVFEGEFSLNVFVRHG